MHLRLFYAMKIYLLLLLLMNKLLMLILFVVACTHIQRTAQFCNKRVVRAACWVVRDNINETKLSRELHIAWIFRKWQPLRQTHVILLMTGTWWHCNGSL